MSGQLYDVSGLRSLRFRVVSQRGCDECGIDAPVVGEQGEGGETMPQLVPKWARRSSRVSESP